MHDGVVGLNGATLSRGRIGGLINGHLIRRADRDVFLGGDFGGESDNGMEGTRWGEGSDKNTKPHPTQGCMGMAGGCEGGEKAKER